MGETARPEVRGFFLCFFDASIVFGQFLIGYDSAVQNTNLRLISRGTSEIDGEWSYLSLIVMLYFFPAVLLIMWPFYPESPYYLIKKGRPEDARKALRRIHGPGDPEFIEIEFRRIEEDVRLSDELAMQSSSHGPGYYLVFRGTNLVFIGFYHRH